MRQYNTAYYLLFVLLIMGSFSAMAQNDYGVSVLGFVAIAFAFIFILQLISYFRSQDRGPITEPVELTGLIVLSAVLCLRIYYIHFPFVEMLFGLAGLMVIVSYSIKLYHSWKTLLPRSKILAYLMTMFYGSIILYLTSMVIFPFVSVLAEPAGGAAFALLVGFALAAYKTGSVLIDGDKISPFAFAARVRDRSVVLAVIFLLFTAYTGLTKIRVIPKMYSDEFPQAYFELVNQAESGKEQRINGAFRHETFKKAYDEFIRSNVGSN